MEEVKRIATDDTILERMRMRRRVHASSGAAGMAMNRGPDASPTFLGHIGDSRCLYFKQKPPIYGGFESG